jgi:hypothetical protein
MGRRGQECRCCAGCSDCEATPTVIKAHIVYPGPEGGSEIVAADDRVIDGVPLEQWTSVTTTCGVPAARVDLVPFIFLTDPGEGYTSPPVLSLTGAGGAIDSQIITIESPVVSFNVTKAGSGYSTAPTVTFSDPAGGGQVTKATAIARVEGPISTLTLGDAGSGYSTPPNVTFATGTGATASVVMNGYVSALELTNAGSEYTSAPSVTISGGGGSGATAVASINKAAETVASVVLFNKGSGYTSPLTVTISGGGGKDATATASILFTVQSISLVAGGSGYPPNPEVTISGGGGSGATATAKISGSVVGVDVLNPGLYLNANQNLGNPSFPDWPTVTLSGGGGSGATAEPVFAGKLRLANVLAGGYATPPTVAFSGGGGTGAAGIAQLEWERDYVRLEKIVDCSALFSSFFGFGSSFHPQPIHCLDATAGVLPPAPLSFCQDNAEMLGWSIRVTTDADFYFSDNDILYFPGEAIRSHLIRAWGAPGNFLSPNQLPYNRVDTHYTQRFFSRVAPALVYRIGLPTQLPENNVTLTPTFRQYADGAGEPYWYLESVAIANAGQNLRVPPGTTSCNLVADGNSRHVVTNAEITVTRSAPVVAAPVLDGFSVQPVIAFTVDPVGAGGFHLISAVAVTSGGATEQADGTVLIDLVLTAGHFTGPAQLSGTIASGTLSAVSLVVNNLIIGPSTLATIELPADPGFTSANRRVTGESPFTTTRSHSQPTVTATEDLGEPPTQLAVTLAQETDLNGEEYWRVASLSGLIQSESRGTIVFEVTEPGIEARPAVAFAFNDEEGDPQYLILSGGKYFVRTTTPTSEPLPPISCIGELNEENGWAINNQQLIADFRGVEVGETFQVRYQHAPPGGGSSFPEVTRTRRCDLPTITLELE